MSIIYLKQSTGARMSKTEGAKLTVAEFKKTVLDDYALAYKSRQASLLGRKEVLTGKAKFWYIWRRKRVASNSHGQGI